MKLELWLKRESLCLVNRVLMACFPYMKVIGDKKGGHTSEMLTDPSKMSILEEINQVVQVPMKFIHVTRNPFDNIATMMLRTIGKRNAVREEEAKVSYCLINYRIDLL